MTCESLGGGSANLIARQTRQSLARSRIGAAYAALEDCHLCAHHCGVNRLRGDLGLCKAGNLSRTFTAQVEAGDEMELIPTFAIAFSGCDLRCDFCITGASSWNPYAGQPLRPDLLAAHASGALARGARTVMFLGGEPTIHMPAVLETVAAMPSWATLVWKTNAHASSLARALLEGLFEIWVADYKFGNDICGQRLAKITDYTRVVRKNLLWAYQNTRLIVRHLLMPGHLDCCWRPIAHWLSEEMPGVKLSLRAGYWPAWHAARHPELRQPVSIAESDRAAQLATELGLHLTP